MKSIRHLRVLGSFLLCWFFLPPSKGESNPHKWSVRQILEEKDHATKLGQKLRDIFHSEEKNLTIHQTD